MPQVLIEPIKHNLNEQIRWEMPERFTAAEKRVKNHASFLLHSPSCFCFP